jgi:hypothetical protein
VTLPSKEIDSIRAQIADLQKRERALLKAARVEKVLRLCASPNAGEAQAARATLKKFHWATVRRIRRLLEDERQRAEAEKRWEERVAAARERLHQL